MKTIPDDWATMVYRELAATPADEREELLAELVTDAILLTGSLIATIANPQIRDALLDYALRQIPNQVEKCSDIAASTIPEYARVNDGAGE